MVRQVIEDQGWAWVILLMNSISHMVEGALVTSVGLFQAEFLKVFSSSASLTSLSSSALLSLQMLLGPIAGTLSAVFGNRQVIIFGSFLLSIGLVSASMMTDLSQIFFTFGICGGIGFGLLYTPHSVIIGHYFIKRRALANGITLAAIGLGLGFGPYVMIALIQNYGWRLSLLVWACMTLQLCPAASTYFPSRAELAHSRNRSRGRCSEIKSCISNLWILKQMNLWIMCVNFGFQMLGWAVHAVHFPGYAESQGIEPQSLSQMFIAFGLTVAISRCLCGVLCNDTNVSMVIVLAGIEGCQGIVTMLMPFYARSYAGCMAYQIVMSLFFGAANVPIAPLTAELFGVTHLTPAFGWIMMIAGLSSLGGPVFAGEGEWKI